MRIHVHVHLHFRIGRDSVVPFLQCAPPPPPQGVPTPVPVTPGYFTLPSTGDNPIHQVAQAPCVRGTWCSQGVQRACPPGVFGAAPLLQTASCTGPCYPGYFCTGGAVNATQLPCGSVAVYVVCLRMLWGGVTCACGCLPRDCAPVRVCTCG
jgi:hypothetical protein